MADEKEIPYEIVDRYVSIKDVPVVGIDGKIIGYAWRVVQNGDR